MPAGANSKRRSHSLGTFSPLELGGAKVQFLAAWIAASAKYLLGPGASNAASVTFPEASTLTFTLTRTLPRIVSRAFWETSGIDLCATWPRAGVEAGALMGGRGLGKAAAGATVFLAANGSGSGGFLRDALTCAAGLGAGSGIVGAVVELKGGSRVGARAELRVGLAVELRAATLVLFLVSRS